MLFDSTDLTVETAEIVAGAFDYGNTDLNVAGHPDAAARQRQPSEMGAARMTAGSESAEALCLSVKVMVLRKDTGDCWRVAFFGRQSSLADEVWEQLAVYTTGREEERRLVFAWRTEEMRTRIVML